MCAVVTRSANVVNVEALARFSRALILDGGCAATDVARSRDGCGRAKEQADGERTKNKFLRKESFCVPRHPMLHRPDLSRQAVAGRRPEPAFSALTVRIKTQSPPLMV